MRQSVTFAAIPLLTLSSLVVPGCEESPAEARRASEFANPPIHAWYALPQQNREPKFAELKLLHDILISLDRSLAQQSQESYTPRFYYEGQMLVQDPDLHNPRPELLGNVRALRQELHKLIRDGAAKKVPFEKYGIDLERMLNVANLLFETMEQNPKFERLEEGWKADENFRRIDIARRNLPIFIDSVQKR